MIHAAETTHDGVTTYHYTDNVDALPPDARNYHTLADGSMNDPALRDAITRVEADGYHVSWQVRDEYYETETKG